MKKNKQLTLIITLLWGFGLSLSATPINTIHLSLPGLDNQVTCENSPITTINYTTTGATGASFLGLPLGVIGSWSDNTVTISGTPISSGAFEYRVSLTGGSGSVSATGYISVNPEMNTEAPNETPTVCMNNELTGATHKTTGATGISHDGELGANGLPAGVSAHWASNTITISGTPTVAGTFNYSIPLTGGCGTVNATGTISVSPSTSAPTGVSPQNFCSQSYPKFSDLVVTGTAIKWYNTSIGGEPITSNTALINGTTYFASQTIGGTESKERLAVAVEIVTLDKPTLRSPQIFCSSSNHRIDNISSVTVTPLVNKTTEKTKVTAPEARYAWYADSIGGTELSPHTLLEDGKVYYAEVVHFACSSERTPMSIKINNCETNISILNNSESIEIISRPSEIQILGEVGENGNAKIYGTDGVLRGEYILNNSNSNNIQLNLAKGLYIILIKSNKGEVNKKFNF